MATPTVLHDCPAYFRAFAYTGRRMRMEVGSFFGPFSASRYGRMENAGAAGSMSALKGLRGFETD